MSGCAVCLLFSLSCRETLSVGPESGLHKVFLQGRALGGGVACPHPALMTSCFLLSGQQEGAPAYAARPLATPKGALPEDSCRALGALPA